MNEPPENRCGYTFPPKHTVSDDGTPSSKGPDYSCCYRSVWDAPDQNVDRCIWHAETDEPKPIDELEDVREEPEYRELNVENGPAELLDGAYIPGVSIDKLSDFDGCYLRRANLRDIHLSDGSCVGAKFVDADLSDAWLRDTDFSGASFSQASLKTTTLEGADLTECSLEDAHLERTNLFNATLSDVRFYGATFTDVKIGQKTGFYSQFQDEKKWFGLTKTRPLVAYDPKLKTEERPAPKSAIKAVYTYNQLSECAAENSLTKLHQQLRIRAQDAKLQHLHNRDETLRGLTMRASRELFLYGESLSRIMILILCTALAATILDSPPIVNAVAVSTASMCLVGESGFLGYSYQGLCLLILNIFSAVSNFYPAQFGLHFINQLSPHVGKLLTALFVFVLGRRSQQ